MMKQCCLAMEYAILTVFLTIIDAKSLITEMNNMKKKEIKTISTFILNSNTNDSVKKV